VGAARRLLARDDLPRVPLPDAPALPDDLRTLLRSVPAT